MSYLHRPKVKREQSYDQEKTGRKALADPLTQQIDNDGNHSEEQMEKGGHGVSKIVGMETRSLMCQQIAFKQIQVSMYGNIK